MYHPTRGGVRGGRDQFSWDDVKVDKHRENYLGHSIKAPVGRWQKGKDLHWYARDKKSDLNSEAMKEEIRRIKEEEEQAMKEALGLAPKRATKSQGNRLDKHEFAELVKRGSTAEDLGAGHAEAAQVHGLGFSRGSRPSEESSLPSILKSEPVENMNISMPTTSARNDKEESEDESSRKKRKHEEKRHEKREKRHSRDSDEKRKHKKHKERRRHDSD
ncbi:Multiple myeloma tumor-associated protein 2 [Sesamum alatum]|uniref:Multiple myeloma tumor-associated protein 2 n=1 Tax=Sesamum alatum TaxID=300844 RepID=A0AAE2CQD1_9LAMI|nr:Multiple myeloma tumor-associated protein 2 [Sesamum alatum]